MESRIRIHCVCGKTGLVDRKHIGKTITCPKCGIARIKIEDPEASQSKDDESESIDIIDEPTTNKKTDIPPVPVIAQGKLSAIRRHWQLTAIICLLAIIAGIMVYNQNEKWVLAEKERRAKEWKEGLKNMELYLEISQRRKYNDESFDEACRGVPIVDVSADDFLTFVAEQPDNSLFANSFETRVLEHRNRDKGFSSWEVENMLWSGDLFFRWAILNGGLVNKATLARIGQTNVLEPEPIDVVSPLVKVDTIKVGFKTIRFIRNGKCMYAFRFGVNIEDLFRSTFWFSDDPADSTFGSFRNRNRNWLGGG